MKMISVSAGPRGLPRFAHILKSAFAHMRERWRIHRHMAELSDLPDYVLRDVGL